MTNKTDWRKSWHLSTLLPVSALFTFLLCIGLLAQPAQAASVVATGDHHSAPAQAPPPLSMAVNLTVSLEFSPSTASLLGYPLPTPLPGCTMNPAAAPPYVADLMIGLCHAAALLNNATTGQFKLGAVKIYAGGEHWADADIRIRADAGYRPSAAVGGVVNTPTVFTPPLQSLSSITYTPGVISLGRCWNGNNAGCYDGGVYRANWASAAGYQVLVHELGHYLFTLHDQYPEDHNPAWNPVACELSLMANPYTIDQFWLHPAQLTEDCKEHNEQWEATHLSDWQRIDANVRSLFAHQSLTPANGAPTITYIPPAGAPNVVVEPRLFLRVTNTLTEPLTLAPQVYWKAMNGNTPVRIFYQGGTTARSQANPLGESLLLAPATANAQLHAYLHSRTGQRFRYTDSLPAANQASITLTAEALHASLNVHYGMTGEIMTALTVTLEMADLATFAPQFYVCTPSQICQVAQATTTLNASRVQAAFHAAPFGEPNGFPQYGVVYIRLNNGKEVLRWFERLNGVRQGRMRAHAPLLDGRVNIESLADPDNLLPGARPSQALMMPATEAGMLEQPLPVGISGLIDLPLDLDVAPGVMTGGDRQLAAPIVVTFFYDPARLQQLGVAAEQLTIVHFDRGSNRWCIANQPNLTVVTGASLQLNRSVVSAPMLVDGIYALAWGPNPANNGYPVPSLCHSQNPSAPPDLQLTKYTNATTLQLGGTLRYELLVRNRGAGAARGPIFVTDALPAPLTASGSWLVVDNWQCMATQNQVTCKRPDALPPGYEITLPLTVTVGTNWPVRATVTNCATVTAPEAQEPYTKNNESCHALPLPLADLGDAPDSTNARGAAMFAYAGVPANFPTVYRDPANIPGPRHHLPKADAWLGRTVSGEVDADQTPDEDGTTNLDPGNNLADRDQGDDGVNPASIVLPNCGPTSLTYDLQIVGPMRERYINLWIDFNRDGDWRDVFTCRTDKATYTVREWAVMNLATTLGPGSYTKIAPLVALLPNGKEQTLWMRVSVSEQKAATPPNSTVADGRGPAAGYMYGETEDYLLQTTKAAQATSDTLNDELSNELVEIVELDPATAPLPQETTDDVPVPDDVPAPDTVLGEPSVDAVPNRFYLPLIQQE